MSTVLYCFSATGNTLTTARHLAEQLGDATIRMLPLAETGPVIFEDAERVGFVFPVYYGDMPYPVRDAISRMLFQEHAYVFGFATCRGHAGDAGTRLAQLLQTRGRKLSWFARVLMPGNSFINPESLDAEYLAWQKENVAAAAKPICGWEEAEFDTGSLLPLSAVAYPHNFRGITADDSCAGCGVCERVCPMGNIRIINGKAVIGENCATCLACFHWCQKEAIWMSRQEGIARRKKYHHPDVKAEDFYRR